MNIGERVSQVEERVLAACVRSGRAREDVTIIAVTKYVSVQEAAAVIKAGLTDIGENRWQNAREKWEALEIQAEWHFIGHLQTNKVKDVIGRFSFIHSLDKLTLAEEISRKAVSLDTVVNVFIQLNVSGEVSKNGMKPEALIPFAEQIRDLPGIRIAGLMTMAPYEAVPEETRPVFRRLRELRDELNATNIYPYRIDGLSMGMSGDFEIAIEEGATFVRLGSILFSNEI
ncbi:MAG: YggS family pyridoxal phosphate-dependent enzyme [Gorillibacterium sp.]|nr:YggS family pyridoxal phosphate-dependent enzyme [Gorillibacterium sp.]